MRLILGFLVVSFVNIFAQDIGNSTGVSFHEVNKALRKASDGLYYKYSKSTMCEGVQTSLPWDPINELQHFVPIDSAAVAWIELKDLYVPVRVKWVFIDPNSNIYFESKSDWTTNPSANGYDHWSWWKLWSWIYIDGYPPADLVNWGNWKVNIYVEENYSGAWSKENTLTFRIDGHNVQIDDSQNEIIPEEFFLSQNYPNPFNSTTIISYSIPEENNVILKLFDILGNEVKILEHESKPAGNYHYKLNADNLPSGLYFYELNAGNFKDIKKFILLR